MQALRNIATYYYSRYLIKPFEWYIVFYKKKTNENQKSNRDIKKLLFQTN